MYCCAFGLLFLIPVAYLGCQVLTWLVYEGVWRTRSLLPIPLVLLSLLPLIWVRSESVVFGVCMGAPAIGLVALACVWGAYSHSAEDSDGASDAEA